MLRRFAALLLALAAGSSSRAAVLPGARPAEGVSPGEAVVELPPFVITETKSERPWRYAEADGFEIISQCGDEATQQVFAALWRGPRLTLPPILQPRLATPTAVILFDQAIEKAGSVRSMGSVQAAHEETSHWTNVIKRTMPDREIFSVNLYGRDFRYTSTFRFDLRTLLALHTPTAPPWLIEALHGNFGLYREGIRYLDGDNESEVLRAFWCSATERAQAEELLFTAHKRFATPAAKRIGALAAASPVAACVPALATLWEGGLAPDRRTPAERTRWAATCALFARWGLYAEKGSRHDAFWRFATQACAQPVTEEFFRECFGLGYDEARTELGWYLPVAVGETASRKIPPLKPPKIKLRAATAAEVARVRGDWERGEATLLATHFPEIAAKYRAKAGRTLRTAQASEPHDPQLAAVLGLYEFEGGDNARATALLTAATAAGHARPRAWFALAHLRFLEVSAEPAMPQGLLDSAQSFAVLLPLERAMAQAPAMAMSYELLAELWRRSAELPPAEISARLAEGQRAFPRNMRIALAAFRACVERGERREALAVLDRALPFAFDPTVRERLEKARSTLRTALARENPP